MEDIFERNGWGDSWRGDIYDYLHYHSRIHEAWGVVRGSAHVRLGGDKGRTFKIAAGDVVILPAGTGHQSLKASKSFMVVGAYPPNGTYDECLPDPKQHRLGIRRVRKVARPRKDPLLGTKGALLRYWKPRLVCIRPTMEQKKLKLALNEDRLLISVTQILFGLQFNASARSY